jgi:hypothetical protein
VPARRVCERLEHEVVVHARIICDLTVTCQSADSQNLVP